MFTKILSVFCCSAMFLFANIFTNALANNIVYENPWLTSIEEGKKLALNSGKDIVLIFSDDLW